LHYDIFIPPREINIYISYTVQVLFHEILGLETTETIFLAEECLEDLLTLPITSGLSVSGLDFDKSIVIRDLGMAFHILQPAEFWIILTDKYSQNKFVSQNHEFNNKNKIYKSVDTAEISFIQALIEYFAISLSEGLLCEKCDLEKELVNTNERNKRLQLILDSVIPKDMNLLEICCGDGIATQALLELGHNPWCMDQDRCDICQSLRFRKLDPRRSFVLDARYLGKFFPSGSFDVVLGFMVGLIDEYNWFSWREILLASSCLARHMVLFTVYSYREAEIIAKSLDQAGWNGHILDNRDSKGIYDQWIYIGKKNERKGY